MYLKPLWVLSMKNYNAPGHSSLLKKIVIVIAEKRKKKFPILLDEIHPHLQRLSVIGEEVDAHFFVTE
jgi:hypothetical protein